MAGSHKIVANLSCVASEPRSHSLNSNIYIEGVVQMLELCSCLDI
jgi:hypothetical protein